MRLVTPELLLGSPPEHLLTPPRHPQKTEAHVVDGQELGGSLLLDPKALAGRNWPQVGVCVVRPGCLCRCGQTLPSGP